MAASINKGRTARGVSETAEKLVNMSIGTRRLSLGQTRPPPMKAGVNWISESGNLLRSGQQIPTERTLTRKVAGWDDEKYLLTLEILWWSIFLSLLMMILGLHLCPWCVWWWFLFLLRVWYVFFGEILSVLHLAKVVRMRLSHKKVFIYVECSTGCNDTIKGKCHVFNSNFATLAE